MGHSHFSSGETGNKHPGLSDVSVGDKLKKEKKLSTDTCYNMNEAWKHLLYEWSQTQKVTSYASTYMKYSDYVDL